MAEYNWTEEDILNSNLSDEYKEILLAELQGSISNIDPSNTHINLLSHIELGHEFRESMRKLQALSPKMADISLNECLKYNPKEEIIINMRLRSLTSQALANEVLYFYESLKDEEINKHIHELMDPRNNHLRIVNYDERNPICGEVLGRCIKNPYQDIIFASYYMHQSLADYTTLSHETAHMLSAKLFGTNINPIVAEYLSEVEAYYFELLCAHYLDTITQDPKLLHVAFNTRLVKSIEYMWDIRKKYLLSRHLIKPSLKRLNKELGSIPNSEAVTEQGFIDLYRYPTSYINVMLHSIFVASDLYQQTIIDREKGLELFKRFMTSSRDNVQDLYRDSNITYLDDDCKNFASLHDDTKTLKKIFKK